MRPLSKGNDIRLRNIDSSFLGLEFDNVLPLFINECSAQIYNGIFHVIWSISGLTLGKKIIKMKFFSRIGSSQVIRIQPNQIYWVKSSLILGQKFSWCSFNPRGENFLYITCQYCACFRHTEHSVESHTWKHTENIR